MNDGMGYEINVIFPNSYVKFVFYSQAYLTTAYFVDPNIICNGGRSQEDFDRDGTGNVLLFQNGPTPEYLEAAPLTAEEAEGVSV